MRKALLATLLALAVAGPAHAEPARYASDCRIHPNPLGPAGGGYSATIYFTIVLYDADATDNPVSADVSCELRIDGSVAGSTGPRTVTVAGADTAEVWISANPVEYLFEVCTVVTRWSDGSPDTEECVPHTTTQIPPDEVLDPVNDALAEHVDPPLCSSLAALPGLPGVVEPNEQGDVFVAGELFWDCPPYE